MRHEFTAGDYSEAHLAGIARSSGAVLRVLHIDQGRPRERRILVTEGPVTIATRRVQVLDEELSGGRDFEHRIELLSDSDRVRDLVSLGVIAEAHGAGLGRDPRRLVVQRCAGTTADEAGVRLDRLLAELRAAGHGAGAVERWRVVHDSDPRLDEGWTIPAPRPDRPGDAVIRESFPGLPATFRPVSPGHLVSQRYVFDPALKQYSSAYRPGEPEFLGHTAGRHWRTARQNSMTGLLTAIATGPWAEHLVLRGSAVMPAWVGEAARPPGDLDFVVVPPGITSDSRRARELLDGIIEASGVAPREVSEAAIWTYERADGRRLVIPFPESVNLQIDVVFGEESPIGPRPVELPGMPVPVLAATAEMSLAWKLRWLHTDMYPQGKDLYDAVLLAERTTLDLDLDLLRGISAATVLTWQDVDWENFVAEYPGVTGTLGQWLRRLALALAAEGD